MVRVFFKRVSGLGFRVFNGYVCECFVDSSLEVEIEVPLSKTSPGFMAAVTLTAPLPMSNGEAGPKGVVVGLADGCSARIVLFHWSTVLAVVCSAEWMADALHVGCFCLTRATTPAMCGVAILVPDIIAKLSPAIASCG